MKTRKNALMMSLIASFLIAMAIVPSYAQTATLSVDPAETVQSTGPVYIDIYVDDVEAMWGFQFKLAYDTNVLTATDFYSWAPFDTPQGPWTDPITGDPTGGEINDAEGYVEMAFSYPMGELYGLTTTAPTLIASVDFSIDATGASPLQIEDSAIADVLGNTIGHMVMCGEFRTDPGLPLAKFTSTPETPVVGEVVTFTSLSTDPGTSIVAWDWDFGDGTTGTGETVTHTYTEPGDYTVTLTVTDNDANTDSQSAALTVTEVPPPGADLLRAYGTPKKKYLRGAGSGIKLRADVTNLDEEESVLVRVVWFVYDENGINLGGVEAIGTVAAGDHSARFHGDFDVTDPRWEFEYEEANATYRVTKEWSIRAECFYNDFDLPTGDHHWAQIEDPTEIYFTLTAIAGGWKK